MGRAVSLAPAAAEAPSVQLRCSALAADAQVVGFNRHLVEIGMRLSYRVMAATFTVLLPSMIVSLSAQVKPDGVRVFTTGHSFHVFVAPLLAELAAAAGITGHDQVGVQGLGAATVLMHWNLPDSTNDAKRALRSGKVDVFTMSPIVSVPDDGISRFAALGLRHNPRLRLLVQASWIPGEQPLPVDQPDRDRWLKDNNLRDQTLVANLWPAINNFRRRLELQVDSLNRAYGRAVLSIVPVGDAVLRLRELVEGGAFPGVAKQSELFRDPVGHGFGPITALTAYCNFAAVYRMSPQGLDLALPGVTPEQHAILQRLAWETISRYQYAHIN